MKLKGNYIYNFKEYILTGWSKEHKLIYLRNKETCINHNVSIDEFKNMKYIDPVKIKARKNKEPVPRKKQESGAPKPVDFYKNGIFIETFDSVSLAARCIGTFEYKINRILKGKEPGPDGYDFKPAPRNQFVLFLNGEEIARVYVQAVLRSIMRCSFNKVKEMIKTGEVFNGYNIAIEKEK